MSLLIFNHQPDQVAIITDTLATTPEGDPLLFTNKVWAVPHMQLLMSGTGVAQLHEAWYRRLNTSLLARDIDQAGLWAPDMLRTLWAELQQRHGSTDATSTVYHFGIPEGEEHFVRYAFRSANNFRAERESEPAVALKPAPIDEAIPCLSG